MIPMGEFCDTCCFKGWNLRRTLKETPTFPIEKRVFPLIFQRYQITFQTLLQTFFFSYSLYMFPLLTFSSEAYLRRLKLQIQRHWSFWRRASHFEVCSAVWVKEPKQSEAARKICSSKHPEQDVSSTWIWRHFLRKKVKTSSNHD